MTNTYANVGKIGNLAQSLLLIGRQNTPFSQTSYLNNNAKPLTDNVLREELRSSISAFFCFFLLKFCIYAEFPSHPSRQNLLPSSRLSLSSLPLLHFLSTIYYLPSVISPPSRISYFLSTIYNPLSTISFSPRPALGDRTANYSFATTSPFCYIPRQFNKRHHHVRGHHDSV